MMSHAHSLDQAESPYRAAWRRRARIRGHAALALFCAGVAAGMAGGRLGMPGGEVWSLWLLLFALAAALLWVSARLHMDVE